MNFYKLKAFEEISEDEDIEAQEEVLERVKK